MHARARAALGLGVLCGVLLVCCKGDGARVDSTGGGSLVAGRELFPKGTAPRIAGYARYYDVDRDGRAGAGDRIVVPFNMELDVASGSVEAFHLPVAGDGFGEGARLEPGPSLHETTIVLGAGAHLRTRSSFAPTRTGEGSASGIGLSPRPERRAIQNRMSGAGATIGEPMDVAPAFVDSGVDFVRTDTTSLAFGDFDQDGDIDMMSAHRRRPNRVWLRQPDGRYTRTSQRLSSRDTLSLAAGDIDHDGKVDVVAGNLGQPTAVWLGRGDGTFREHALLGSARTRHVVLADVDRDGHLDLLEGNEGANAVWLGDGRGGLVLGALFGASPTTDLALGDLDRDGDLDVVETTGENRRNCPSPIWLGDGAGSFTLSGGLGSSDARRLALGDVDHDGHLDVVQGASSSNHLFFGDGRGAFAMREPRVTPRAWAPVLGDVDGDGDLDLVQASSLETTVHFGDGSGQFHASGITLATGEAREARLLDVDGDGDLDLALATERGPELWLSSLSGTFGGARFVDSGITIGGGDTFDLLLEDLDGDGWPEVLEACSEGLRVWPNRGGAFGAPRVLRPEDPSATVHAIALADFDRNGAVDIVAGGFGSSQVWLADAGAANGFRSGARLDVGRTWDVVAGDLDGDGDVDVVEGNEAGVANRAWLQVEALRFVDPYGFDTADGQSVGSTTCVLTGDLDRDGRPDLVTSSIGEPVRVWRNSGTGRFALHESLDARETRAMALGDVDRDGDLDLVTGGSGAEGAPTRVWLNRGRGRFEAGPELTRTEAHALLLADLDGDGRLDLVLGNFHELNQYLRGNGDGTFELVQEFGGGPTRALAAGDLDADGDLDLVEGLQLGGANRVWWND